MIGKVQSAYRNLVSLGLKLLDFRRQFRDRKTISYSSEQEHDMEKRPKIIEYRSAEFRLGQIREENFGKDSSEEDDHLDYMDTIWHQLKEEEVDYLNCHQGPYYQYAIKYIK